MTDDLSNPIPTPDLTKINASFQQLKAAATQLNVVSDVLGKSIAAIDLALRTLNLGIEHWVQMAGDDSDTDGNYWSRDLGYAKVDGKWGIALREAYGNRAYDSNHNEEWLFNDAPRRLRIEAVDSLPDLLDGLTAAATETAGNIRDKIAHAQGVVEAITETRNPRVRK